MANIYKNNKQTIQLLHSVFVQQQRQKKYNILRKKRMDNKQLWEEEKQQQQGLEYTLYSKSIDSVIPLSIYQCWHSDNLPNCVKENIDNIKHNNPEFNHYLFNEDQCRIFIQSNFPEKVLYAYDSINPEVCAIKVDLWRYCVLYKNGGIYLDVKYKCINNFKFIFLTDKEYFCNDIELSGFGVYNAIIICKPGNDILLKCINKLVDNITNSYYGNNPLSVSGPLMIRELLTPDENNSIILNHTYKEMSNKLIFYYICYDIYPILQINNNYRKEQLSYFNHWTHYWINKLLYVNKYKVENYHEDKPFYFAVYDNCIISDIIKRGEIWEEYMHRVFEKYITKDSIVLEGGCHIGTHTLKLASLCNHLYAFEPLPASNKLLDYNIKTNNINNVTLFCLGLSDKIGETQYSWISEGNPGSAGLDNNPMGKPQNTGVNNIIKVTLTTIDTLNLDKLDFIKLDVEGYESLVISGGINTIQKCKPIISLESWSSHNGTVDIEYTKNIFKVLIDIGYTITNNNMEQNCPEFLFLPPL